MNVGMHTCTDTAISHQFYLLGGDAGLMILSIHPVAYTTMACTVPERHRLSKDTRRAAAIEISQCTCGTPERVASEVSSIVLRSNSSNSSADALHATPAFMLGNQLQSDFDIELVISLDMMYSMTPARLGKGKLEMTSFGLAGSVFTSLVWEDQHVPNYAGCRFVCKDILLKYACCGNAPQ